MTNQSTSRHSPLYNNGSDAVDLISHHLPSSVALGMTSFERGGRCDEYDSSQMDGERPQENGNGR